MVIAKKSVDSDEVSIKPDEDPTMVGVKGVRYCFLCGKKEPKCKMCYCEETIQKIVTEKEKRPSNSRK
jgi:hypothetical protein